MRERVETAAPVVVVGAIVVDDAGRLLVVKRANPPAQGRWSVPGGRVELGESLADAVAREVLEETGLVVEVGALAGVAEVNDGRYHVVILDHHARVTGGELLAGDDAAAVAWLRRSELDALELTDGLIAYLEQWGVQLAP